MKNEPVAWMHQNPDYAISKHQSLEYNIPLYTHPVKEQDTDCQYCKQGCIRCDARKQLTDEEIKALWKPMPDTKTYESDVLKFARAIMKRCGIISGTDK